MSDRRPPARFLKAIHLADMLDAAGLGSSDATAMDSEDWRMLATAAHTRIPSPETRSLVLTFLQHRETARATFAASSRI